MSGNIDFRDKYIASLEDQIEMYKKQQNLHLSQVGKLHDRIRDLEYQLSDSKKRKASDDLASRERAPAPAASINGDQLMRNPASDLRVTTNIMGSLSLPNSPIGGYIKKGSATFKSPMSDGRDGRTLPPFHHIRYSIPSLAAPHSSFQESQSRSQSHNHGSHMSSSGEQQKHERIDDDGPSEPACDGCRIRKRKCTRERPECVYCVKLNRGKPDPIPCTYPQPKRNRTITMTEKKLRMINESRSAVNTPPTSAPVSADTSPASAAMALGKTLAYNSPTAAKNVPAAAAAASRSPPESAPVSRTNSPEHPSKAQSPTQQRLDQASSTLLRISQENR